TEAKVVMDVPKTVFIPQPNVTSSVLKLQKRAEPLVKVYDEELFFSIVQAGFAHRRKTLRNNLVTHYKNTYEKEFVEQVLKEAEIDGKRRGESLTIQEFAQLSNTFYHYLNQTSH